MATNLITAGFSVRCFDPDADARQRLVALGAEEALNARDAAAGAQLVIFMVPDVPQIEANLDGPNGILATPGSGRILMVMYSCMRYVMLC